MEKVVKRFVRARGPGWLLLCSVPLVWQEKCSHEIDFLFLQFGTFYVCRNWSISAKLWSLDGAVGRDILHLLASAALTLSFLLNTWKSASSFPWLTWLEVYKLWLSKPNLQFYCYSLLFFLFQFHTFHLLLFLLFCLLWACIFLLYFLMQRLSY